MPSNGEDQQTKLATKKKVSRRHTAVTKKCNVLDGVATRWTLDEAALSPFATRGTADESEPTIHTFTQGNLHRIMARESFFGVADGALNLP